MQTIKKLFYLLTKNEQKKLMRLFFVVLFMGLVELLGLTSILPFVAMLSDPSIVENNSILNSAYQASSIFGIENKKQFLFFSGVLTFILLVFSLFVKSLTTYLQINFTASTKYNIEKRIITGYLNQSYSWFLDRHSADLGKNILSEVNTVVQGGIRPMIDLIAGSMVAILVVILLIVVDPKLALIVGLILGSTYLIIYLLIRGYLNFIGEERLKANRWRFTMVTEAFGAIKEIKIGGMEQAYINRYAAPAKKLTKYEAIFSVLTQLPRFAIEAVSFGGLILIVLYLMAKSNNFLNIVPIIALYALAGYRLIPLLQRIFISINALRYVSPPLNSLNEEFQQLKTLSLSENKEILQFKKEIKLNQVNFAYSNVQKQTLRNINIKIPMGSYTGIVGATGSGKTTLIDIILGLLEPQDGKLEVDDKIIDENNRRAWQRSIGYVPQQIFLTDDTIAANIALGLNLKDIDQNKVEKAAKISSLHEFIINDLPLKYQSIVGERGVKLSGGQRQRIGIARALYHDPQVLIMDEATNALDNITEQTVMDTVFKLKRERTIILITHRLSSVKNCDNIILVEKGEIKQQGTFEKLSQANNYFKMINGNTKNK
jgi:ABC-type bacteriocin/lantibiotic exporter with double-glycine peptidase domain